MNCFYRLALNVVSICCVVKYLRKHYTQKPDLSELKLKTIYFVYELALVNIWEIVPSVSRHDKKKYMCTFIQQAIPIPIPVVGFATFCLYKIVLVLCPSKIISESGIQDRLQSDGIAQWVPNSRMMCFSRCVFDTEIKWCVDLMLK